MAGIGGGGGFGDGGDGGPAVSAQLMQPRGMSVAPDGTLYFSVGRTNGTSPELPRVRRITPEGTITTFAGTGVVGSGGDAAFATAATVTLSVPWGTAVAPDGSVYVAVRGSHRIRRVLPVLPGITDAETLVAREDGAQAYRFDALGRHLATVSTLTGTADVTFGYNAGRLQTLTDADGNVTTIERDASGVATALVAPGGQRTTLSEPTAAGYLTTITDPAQAAHVATFTASGLMERFRTPRLHTAAYAYDAFGRLRSAQDASATLPNPNPAKLLEVQTDETGRTVTYTSPLGRSTTYAVARLATGATSLVNTAPSLLVETTTIGADGIRVTTFPDGMTETTTLQPDFRFGLHAPVFSRTLETPGGTTLVREVTRSGTLNGGDLLDLASATESVLVNGRTPPFTRTYTKVGAVRTLTSMSSELRRRTWTLDSQGRVVTDAPDGVPGSPLDPVLYSYQAGTGLLETVRQGTGGAMRTVTLHYDAQQRLDQLLDPLARETLLGYDAADRVTTLTLPGRRVVGFTYDANGNLATVTPPHAAPPPVHAFDYTPVDQPALYTPPAVPGTGATSYSYNDDRQLELITRPDGQTIDPVYDAPTGRLQTVTWRDGSDVVGESTYSYHLSGSGAGHVSAITSTVPRTSGLAFSYDGPLLTQTTWTGLAPGPVTVGRTYDDDFRVQATTVNGAAPITFTYDQDGLVTGAGAATLERSGPRGLVATVTVGNVVETRTYNPFGELASLTAVLQVAGQPDQPLLGLTYPTRDPLGRIVAQTEAVEDGPTRTITYGYNAAGELQDVTRDGVPVAPSPAYTYDPNGNRLTAPGLAGTPTYDAQDRLLSYGDTSYEYTANGELLRKTTGPAVTEYVYDVFGSLRAVTLPDGTAIEYVIDTLHRRVGRRVNGTLERAWLYDDQLRPIAQLDGAGTVVSRFVYASRATVPDYLVKAGTTYRILADHLGSVCLVVEAATGAIAPRIDYDEFGNATLISGTWDVQPFGFAGGLYDSGTGLVRFGVRDYDAETGRWTARDPVLFLGGDANLYGYLLNDPINYVDPLGLASSGETFIRIEGAGALFTVGGFFAAAGTALLFTPTPLTVALGLGLEGLAISSELMALDLLPGVDLPIVPDGDPSDAPRSPRPPDEPPESPQPSCR